MKQKFIIGLFAIVCLSQVFQPVWAASDQALIVKPLSASSTTLSQPDPERLIRSMTAYMKALPQFYVSGEAYYDKVYQDNNKIQYSFDFDYYVKRPGEFQFNFEGDLHNKQILFNGKSITIYDEDKAVYAVMETPPTIDGALDKAAAEYGLSLAILDVARSDFGDNILKDVSKSAYVGLSNVGGILCHHVAFVKEAFNLQLWIETGDRPFIRKFVVTFKNNPAMPNWSAEITDWTLSPVLPNGWTTFVPKPGMKKIEFMKPSNQAAAPTK